MADALVLTVPLTVPVLVVASVKGADDVLIDVAEVALTGTLAMTVVL